MTSAPEQPCANPRERKVDRHMAPIWRRKRKKKQDRWIVDYRDTSGIRRRLTASTRREAEGGAPITYVAAQLGHRKPTTTLMFYAHWIPGGDKSHIDRLAAARLAVEPKVPPTLLDETGVPKE